MSKYVSVKTLADTFGVSVSTIRSWIKDGHIPRESYIRTGGNTYRFNLRAVEAHLTTDDSQPANKVEAPSLDDIVNSFDEEADKDL